MMRKKPFMVLSFMFIVLGFFLSYNLRLFERYFIFSLNIIMIIYVGREEIKKTKTLEFILMQFGQWL